MGISFFVIMVFMLSSADSLSPLQSSREIEEREERMETGTRTGSDTGTAILTSNSKAVTDKDIMAIEAADSSSSYLANLKL